MCAHFAPNANNSDGITLTSFILGMISSCLLHGHCNKMYIEFEPDPSAGLVSNNSYCIQSANGSHINKERQTHTDTHTRAQHFEFIVVFFSPRTLKPERLRHFLTLFKLIACQNNHSDRVLEWFDWVTVIDLIEQLDCNEIEASN